VNTPNVYAALRERFAAPEWAIFFEVANGTGHHGRRYADAVAMNLYPSRGLELHGFEVKVSRSDWHRELVNPDKAEDIFKYCDRWWLVIGERDIVKPGELPATWGLIAPKGNALAIITQAPKLEPVPLDRPFFAALTRRAAAAPQKEIEAIVRARVDKQLENDRRYERQTLAHERQTHEKFREKVRAFEAASGLSIERNYNHTPVELGEAVKFVLDGGLKSIDTELATLERKAAHIAETIKSARATPTPQATTPEVPA